MSIHIIEGLPRHGKTTFAVLNALEWRGHWRRQGKDPRRIIANFPVNVPGVEYVENFLEMRNLDHCVILIDEAYKWFGAHDSKENAQFLTFFTEHGKDANTLYLIAHKAAMLDVSIRSRTAESIWHVKRLMGPNRWEDPSRFERLFGWWAMCTQWLPSDQTAMKTAKPIKTRWINLRKLHGQFDTLTKIGRMHEGKNKQGAGLAASASARGGAVARQSVLTLTGRVLKKAEWLDSTDLTGWGGHVRPIETDTDDDLMDALRGQNVPAAVRVPVLQWSEDGTRYERVWLDADKVAAWERRQQERRRLVLAGPKPAASLAGVQAAGVMGQTVETRQKEAQSALTGQKEAQDDGRQAGRGPDLGELHGVRDGGGSAGGASHGADGASVGGGHHARFRVVG